MPVDDIASAGVGSALPSQVGVTSGWALTTNGTVAAWADVSGSGGVTTMAAVGSTPSANGASISTTTLTLQPASATLPGVVTAAAQAFGGLKTLVAGVKTGAVATAAEHSLLGSTGGLPFLWLGSAADAPDTSNYALTYVASFGLLINMPSGSSSENVDFKWGGGGTPYMRLTGTGGHLQVQYGNLDLVANGALPSQIKMKSPNGTQYTVSIADGGTLVIA